MLLGLLKGYQKVITVLSGLLKGYQKVITVLLGLLKGHQKVITVLLGLSKGYQKVITVLLGLLKGYQKVITVLVCLMLGALGRPPNLKQTLSGVSSDMACVAPPSHTRIGFPPGHFTRSNARGQPTKDIRVIRVIAVLVY